MTEKFAEKLMVLNEHGVLLLQRVYNMKQVFGSERKPAILADKKCKENIAALVKHFPQLEFRKVQKLTEIAARKVDIHQDFSYWYGLTNMILDFKNRATELLHEVNTKLKGLSLIFHFDIVVNFFELLCTLVSIIMMFFRIEDRKNIITLFAGAHAILKNGESEPRYAALAEFLQEFDCPVHGLVNLFNPISTQLGSMLCSLTHLYKRERTTAKLLRNQNKHSLTHKPQDMGVPDVWVAMRFTTRSLNDFTRWICLGFLCVPNEVTVENDVAFQLVKTVLQESWNIQLCFDECLQIHNELETAATYVKRKELKKLIDDQIPVLNTQVSIFHSFRRQCVRHCLQQMIEVINDQPGILGPKIAAVLSALSFAKNELFWYLRHIGNPLKKMKYKEEDWIDHEFPELVYLTEKLLALLVENEAIVCKYHLEFLVSYDAPKLGYLVKKQSSANAFEMKLLNSFIESLENVGELPEGEDIDFDAWRMDWFRLQARIANARGSSQLQREQELLRTLNITCFHVTCVDDFHSLLQKATNLKDLFYYQSFMWSSFEKAIQHPVQVQFTSVFPAVVCQYPSTDYETKEQLAIGKSSKKITDLYLEKMTTVVVHWIIDYAQQLVKHGQQLGPENCGSKVRANHRKTLRKQGNNPNNLFKQGPGGLGSDKEKEKVYVPPRSELENVKHVENLSQHISKLLACINTHTSIAVYDTEYSPVAYLGELLKKKIFDLISTLAEYDPISLTIKRPSMLAREIESFLGALMSIETFVDLDVAPIFVEAMAEHSNALNEQSLTAYYMNWYNDFFSKKILNCSIIYSGLRKSFVSHPQSHFKIEDYGDFFEFVALVKIIGPRGMHSMKQDVMKNISDEVGAIKVSLRSQKENLNQLNTLWKKREFRPVEGIKRIKGLDDLFARSSRIGLLLSFLTVTKHALRHVHEERIPQLYHAMSDMITYHHDEYISKDEGNSKKMTELISLTGAQTITDPELKEFLNQHCQQAGSDFETWQSMITMYSFLMYYLCSDSDTLYRPNTEGHPNNAHLLATTINTLTSCLMTLSNNDPDIVKIEQERFLEMTSLFLLRIRGIDFPDKDQKARNIESVIIILDKFCTESDYVTHDILEKYYPYALLRNSYTLLHSRQVKTKKTGMFRTQKVIQEE